MYIAPIRKCWRNRGQEQGNFFFERFQRVLNDRRTYKYSATRYVSAVLYERMSAKVLVIFKSGHLASPWLRIGEYSNITSRKDKYILRFYYRAQTHNPDPPENSQQHLFYGDSAGKNCSKWPHFYDSAIKEEHVNEYYIGRVSVTE